MPRTSGLITVDCRRRFAGPTAIAKVACNQAGFEVASEAMQIMGAMGFSRETLVEYWSWDR
jgi:alkylation response protein AidB-like acyl-CoA dehydrogenase